MADPADRSISADQLHGMKQLRRVAGLLSHLHEAGCDRDQAGNRELHFDDYVLLILLYLFNPLIDSMRTLQRVSELPEIQSRLGIKRFSLGSFSESCRVFDPAMLQAVVDELAEGLLPVQRAALLRDLPGKMTLVDSTRRRCSERTEQTGQHRDQAARPGSALEKIRALKMGRFRCGIRPRRCCALPAN